MSSLRVSTPWFDETGGESSWLPGGCYPGDSGGTAPDFHRLPLLPPYWPRQSTTAANSRQLAVDLRGESVDKPTPRWHDASLAGTGSGRIPLCGARSADPLAGCLAQTLQYLAQGAHMRKGQAQCCAPTHGPSPHRRAL